MTPLATSVVPQTSFGLTSVVGTSSAAARADHSHGTPTLPAAGGDLTGTLTGARVVALQQNPVSSTVPLPGQVLSWSGTSWTPATVNGATPGSSVNAATSFGLVSTPGASAAYSRADHSHGTPVLPALSGDLTGTLTGARVVALQENPVSSTVPLPGQVLSWSGTSWTPATVNGATPGSSVNAATSFGLVSTPGASAAYSRADHSHGTPVLPALGGDLTGVLSNATVTRLRNTPVSALAPAPGDVLQFDGANWVPVGAPLVVAAAVITGSNTVVGPRVGGLSVTSVGTGTVSMSFTGYVQPTAAVTYLVKVTPMTSSSIPGGYVTLFQSFNASSFTLAVRDLTGASPNIAVIQGLSFMVEVSRVLP